jgi:3-oxoacyl-[acyl-carrier protein] reductase
MSPAALVIGVSGSIGAAIKARLEADGFEVWGTSRSSVGDRLCVVDSMNPQTLESLRSLPELSVVVWAHGVNVNDSILDVDPSTFASVLHTNTTFVVEVLRALLSADRILEGARMCVVSSIWQTVTRRGKLSYTVSKAAIDGLVRSISADLACKGILMNAVLPGVVDTSMTRSMLGSEQIACFEQATGFGRLVTLDDVSSVVAFLCSPLNSGVTGQSIAVDLGFGHVRNL